MSQPLNPYEPPREPEDSERDDIAGELLDDAVLAELRRELRRLQPWLFGVAILTGFPGGAIATGSIGLLGITGCAGLVPTAVLVLVMVAAARIRFAARAIDRKATPQRLIELVSAMTLFFVSVALVWLIAAAILMVLARGTW